MTSLHENHSVSFGYFLDSSNDRFVYLGMLEMFVDSKLETLQPLIIFQQDGAPLHWALCVREYLNLTFPTRSIGRYGSTKLPPRSLDLTPL